MKLARTLLAVSIAAACTHAVATPPVDTMVAVGRGAHALATDPLLRRAFVSNHDDGTVSIVDFTRSAILANAAAGPNPVAMLSDAARSRVYVLNDVSPGTLTVLDAVTGGTLARVPLGDRPQGMAADFKRGQLYVTNSGSNALSVVDVATNSVLASIPVGNAPQGIAIDSARGRIYVSNTLDATVSVVDAKALGVIATVAVGHNPGVPAVDARTGRVFVNAADDRAVAVIDGDAQAVVDVVSSGSDASRGTLSPVYRKLYLPSATAGSVTILDLDSLVSSSVRVGRLPRDVSIDADAGVVYVANRASGTVSIVDPQRNVVADAFAASPDASDVAIPEWGDRALVVGESGSTTDSATFVPKATLVPDTAIVAEYVAPASGRYFSTAEPVERRLLDDGLMGSAWTSTETYFRVWTAPGADRIAVCRFATFGTPSGTSYTYGLGKQCVGTKAQGDAALAVYYVALPDANGACARGTEALYRVVAKGADGAARYRLTPYPAVRDALFEKNSAADGAGDTLLCTPSLRNAVTETPGTPDGNSAPIRLRVPLRTNEF